MNENQIGRLLSLILLVSMLLALVYIRASTEREQRELPTVSATVAPTETLPTEPPATSVPTPSPTEPTATPEVTEPPEPVEPVATEEPIPDIDISSWEYIIANTENRLDASFAPPVTELENGHYFDSRAVEPLKSFLQGARDAGLTVILSSSYRPYVTQEYLFNNKVAQYGGDEATAARIVARPGTSEHQTALSADIVDQYYQFMDESLANTELSIWMKEHCAEYGFILRYPQDKQDITGIMFEPWHFRYVGVEAATYIMEKGLCFEEFVALYE